MFNSVALDVVIGMVMIYLLYSLLVTILGEMIASWLGIRARVLRRAIERMLNDGYEEDRSDTRTQRLFARSREFFLREHRDFRQSFAGQFYEYPAIKYLSEKQKNYFSPSKPSYFTKEIFAQTLIHLLREKGAGKPDMEKISFCLAHNTLRIQSQTLSYLKNLFEDAKGDPEAFAKSLQNWFEETMYRTTGWYKKKNRLIMFLVGFLIAVSFNVDSIKIVRLLSKDTDARGQLVSMGIAAAKDTARFKDFIYRTSDTLPHQTVFDSVFVRVTKDVSDANGVLGLGWKVPNTKAESKKIQGSDTAVQRAIRRLSFWQERGSTLKRIAGKKCLTDSITRYRFHRDSLTMELASQAFLSGKQIDTIKKAMSLDNVEIVNATERDKILSVAIHNCEDSAKNARLELRKMFDKNFERIDSIVWQENLTMIYGQIPRGGFAQFWYRLWFILSDGLPGGFWGFMITALMLSLGAPFWFGVLQKLVALRSAGVKPEDKKETNAVDDTNPIPIRPTTGVANPSQGDQASTENLVEAALKIYGDDMRNEEGVVDVYKGYETLGTRTDECVQVNVMNEAAKMEIQKKYSQADLFKKVKLRIVVTGKAKKQNGVSMSLDGNPDLGLANTTELFGWGSFGCIMINNDDESQKFLVSCYHVMNGDFQWDNDGVSRTVKNHHGTIVSDSYQGCLNSKLDTAYAGPVSNDVYKYYSQWNPKGKREITKNDVNKTKVQFKGYKTKFNQGIVVNDSCPGKFEYPISNNTVINQRIEELIAVSKVDSNNTHSPISQDGDSGSLVTDEDGNALGIIVGSDLVQTFVIRISAIEDELGLTFKCRKVKS